MMLKSKRTLMMILKKKWILKMFGQNTLTQTFEVSVLFVEFLKETFQLKTFRRWSLIMDGAHSTTVQLAWFTSRNLTSNLKRNIWVTIKEQQYGFMIHLLMT